MSTAGGGIVTPEAVRLDFEEATIGTRAVAIVIDWLIQGTVLLLLTLAAGFVFDPIASAAGDVAVIIIVLVTSFLVIFGYPIGFEVAWRGRTPGKAAMGLRVVTLEGAPVAFRHAAIRAALGLVDFALTSGAAAVFTVLLSRRSQRVGDHVAGTVVVRERVAGGRAEAATFEVPHGAEAYAGTIDPAGARPADYEAAREFLLRAAALPADRRHALSQQLATSIAARLAHRIPPEVHPEVFLRCFAARYQQRTPSATSARDAADRRSGTDLARPPDSRPAGSQPSGSQPSESQRPAPQSASPAPPPGGAAPPPPPAPSAVPPAPPDPPDPAPPPTPPDQEGTGTRRDRGFAAPE